MAFHLGFRRAGDGPLTLTELEPWLGGNPRTKVEEGSGAAPVVHYRNRETGACFQLDLDAGRDDPGPLSGAPMVLRIPCDRPQWWGVEALEELEALAENLGLLTLDPQLEEVPEARPFDRATLAHSWMTTNEERTVSRAAAARQGRASPPKPRVYFEPEAARRWWRYMRRRAALAAGGPEAVTAPRVFLLRHPTGGPALTMLALTSRERSLVPATDLVAIFRAFEGDQPTQRGLVEAETLLPRLRPYLRELDDAGRLWVAEPEHQAAVAEVLEQVPFDHPLGGFSMIPLHAVIDIDAAGPAGEDSPAAGLDTALADGDPSLETTPQQRRDLDADGVFRLAVEECLKDGELSEREKAALRSVAGLLNLSDQRAVDIFRQVGRTYKSGELRGHGEMDPIELLDRVFASALADGVLTGEEIGLVRALAVILGIAPGEFEQVAARCMNLF